MNNALRQETSLAGQMKPTAQLTQSLSLAAQLAPSLGHSQVVPAHLLLVLLEDSEISFLLNAHGVDIKEAKTSVLKQFPKITPKAAVNNQTVPAAQGLNIVLNHAMQSAAKNNLSELSSTLMFATLLREDNAFSHILDDYELSYEGVSQFLEMQLGKEIKIDPVPTYTIEDSAFAPPAPKAAPPPSAAQPIATPATQSSTTPAPAMPAPSAAAISAAPTPSAPTVMAATATATAAPTVKNPKKSKVISFSNILKRQGGDSESTAPTPTPEQASTPQQPTVNHSPISRPVPAQTGTATPSVNTTHSATGSVIEKGILVVPEPLALSVGKPHIIDVYIAQNPQAQSPNPSYDTVVMEALTTQLHAPGQNFHIKSLLPETHWIDNAVQANPSAHYGQWQWEITPLQSGTTKLSLVVSSRTLNKDNQLSSVTLPEKAINITVGMNKTALMLKLFLLLAVIGLGIAAYLFLPKFM